MDGQGFSIQRAYNRLIGEYEAVPWHRLLTKNLASPRCKFFLWLICWQQLPTFDRLKKWNFHPDEMCRLCSTCPKSHHHQHLFLECPWVCELRAQVFYRMNDHKASSLPLECVKVNKIVRKNLLGQRSMVFYYLN